MSIQEAFLRLNVPNVDSRPTDPDASVATTGSGSETDKKGRHYFRLGRYVPTDESAMMPQVKLSRTTSTSSSVAAPTVDTGSGWQFWIDWKATDLSSAETANATTDTTKGTSSGSYDQAYLQQSDGTYVKNTSSQMSLEAISSTHVAQQSAGSGILGWTTDDINVKSGGGLSLDIGTAIAMEAENGDITMAIPKGAYIVSAAEGISLTAGSADNPANISMVAYGYVKQEAKGPVTDWKYSTSETTTYGWSKDYFYGDKLSEFHGDATSNTYGTSTSNFFGQSNSYFNGDKLTCNLAGNATFNMSGDFTLSMSLSLSINVSLQMNVVFPFRLTFLGTDFKMAIVDFKVVRIDGKVAAYKMEVVTTTIETVAGAKLADAPFKTTMAAFGFGSGLMKVDGKNIKFRTPTADVTA